MFPYLLLLFVVLPVVELALLLRISQFLQLSGTLLLVVLTGIVGVGLARWQGLQILGKIQRDLGEGRMPAPYLIDGLLILFAGAVLITPGLLTDAIGFLLLIPVTRGLLKQQIRLWLERKLRDGTVEVVHWEW